jgi:hypothetical protein
MRNASKCPLSHAVIRWIAGLISSIALRKTGIRGTAYRYDLYLAKAFEASELTGVVDGFVLAPKVQPNFCRLADRQFFL